MSERTRLRHYEIEREIARGGMAVVYLALDTRSGQWVALKQMLPGIFHDPEFAARFRREVRIHASLVHPNILRVHDFEAGPETYYIAMELVDGGTLRNLCDRIPLVPVEVSLHVAAEVLRGLAHAHASGIIHRDVKPQNVLISRAGQVKVADFGISKTDEMTRLTLTGNLVGTPSYMSPEQASLQPVDARSDVFSCGVMLYELLAGHNPFATSNPVASIKLISEHTPPPLCEIEPRLPIACELLAERMLAKQPQGRFASAEAALAAIEAVLADLEIPEPAAAFRRFLQGPARYLQQRNGELALRHRQRAEQLTASGAASDELVLWETYLAHRHDPSHEPTARRLAAEAQRTGYLIEPAPATPRVLEAERQLRDDPDNPQAAPPARQDPQGQPQLPAAHALLLPPAQPGPVGPLPRGPGRHTGRPFGAVGPGACATGRARGRPALAGRAGTGAHPREPDDRHPAARSRGTGPAARPPPGPGSGSRSPVTACGPGPPHPTGGAAHLPALPRRLRRLGGTGPGRARQADPGHAVGLPRPPARELRAESFPRAPHTSRPPAPSSGPPPTRTWTWSWTQPCLLPLASAAGGGAGFTAAGGRRCRRPACGPSGWRARPPTSRLRAAGRRR
ncbi:MAG: protein kinase [Thermoanaerobaculaceae bacterium]